MGPTSSDRHSPHAQPPRRRPAARLRAPLGDRGCRCPLRPGQRHRRQPHLAADPAVVLAALHRSGRAAGGDGRRRPLARPCSWAGPCAAGAHPRTPRRPRAPQALDLPPRPGAGPSGAACTRRAGFRAAQDPWRPAEAFRSGLARLVERTGAPVVPVGQAGARRLVPAAPRSSWPVRSPPRSAGRACTSTWALRSRRRGLRGPYAQAHGAVTAAWRSAVGHLAEWPGEPHAS